MSVRRALEFLREVISLAADRLRARALALRGARVGPKVRIGPRCQFEKPWCIALLERCRLESDVYVKVTNSEAAFVVGRYTFVGRGTEFDVSREVRIGDQALIAPGCFLTDHSHRFRDRVRLINDQGCEASFVRVGDDAWLGAGVVVLPGVMVGAGAVVGARSVVRSSIPDYEVHVGAPARRVGERR